MAVILIVEDDPHLLQLYSSALTKAGHEVSSAENGEEGIRRAEELRPDLILMDMQMPVMDGLQSTQHLKESPLKQIPIVALTNLQLPDQIAAALDAGCDGYIVKPLDADELLQELSLVLADEELFPGD